ncbi:lysylphosphatidylglycerol synthase transmembrane domain-containing protein [Virgibacillus sp. DJP39]|uniref:lysylphosphatidylglycerol synthase transmembrane domain-containing protein n=1 Tax=Virgibacillus sp. DJP39 TaxID=3409790 RepID=UPI003BB7B047
MGKKTLQPLIHLASIFLFSAFLVLSWNFFDLKMLFTLTQRFFLNFHWLFFVTILYLLAFVSRAFAWKMYGDVKHPIKIYLVALFYSLFFNHIFPIKIGDVVRIGVFANQKDVTWDKATHSVVVMRILDLMCLGIFASVGALLIGVSLNYYFLLKIIVVFAIIGLSFLYLLKKKWFSFYLEHVNFLKEAFFHQRSALIISLVFTSWILEAAVVYGVVHALEFDIALLRAVWLNSITVAAQVFQFTPGGLATYESVMSFAFVQLGMKWEDAYNLALITHGFKFLFSFVVGFIVFFLYPISLRQIKVWKNQKGEKL